MSNLRAAWDWRSERGLFEDRSAVRVFHGPGEGLADLQYFAVDRFNDHYWVTQWDHPSLTAARITTQRQVIVDFLRSRGAQSVVGLDRPQRGVAPQAEVWWGEAPSDPITVREGSVHFLIRLRETRHPGLFLDHRPLREWLMVRARGWRVLNTFSYTGSLSVAAALGGAASVTTLDLSKPSIQWARENFKLNGLPEGESEQGNSIVNKFIAGDVFEWLPRLRKSNTLFDCVILDPPSFSHGKGSHGKKGNFSTAKDLTELHQLALSILAPKGFLVTSINSANIPWQKFESDLLTAAKEINCELQVLRMIDLPETFPTRLGRGADRYLKGWILRRV